MPDSYGPDFLTKSMFFREAEQGPSQQDLATMTAPFGGSPQQAMGFMQSPGMQQQLQHFGMHFDPSQIRQSPFFPNSFLQGHPQMRGALSGAMGNIAATPEAPLVSGAGSGITRAMQGMYGGPEMQRQYQVRQMMAPMQAMGMQMPLMAEQRRQQLLQALEQDMQQRRQAELQKTPGEKIKDDIYAPPNAPGYFQMQQPHPLQMMMPGAGMTGQGGPGPSMQGPMQPGGPQFHPYDPSQVHGLAQARQTDEQAAQRGGAGALSSSKAKEQTKETDLGMPGARVEAEQGLGAQRRAAADKSRAGAEHLRWQSSPEGRMATTLAQSDHWFAQAMQQVDGKYNPLIAQAQADKNDKLVQTLESQRQNEIAAQTQAYLVGIQHRGGQLTPEQQAFLSSRPQAGSQPSYGKPNPAVSPGAGGSAAAPRPGGTVGNTSATTAPSSSWDQIKQQRQAQQQQPQQ